MLFIYDDYFNDLLNDFCSKRRFFCDYSDEKLESNHFYSWFNIFANREYDNNYVNDMYVLHEIHHIAKHNPVNESFDLWKDQITLEEIYASVFSEAYVYFAVEKHLGVSIRNKVPFDLWINTLNQKSYSFNGLVKERFKAINNPKNKIEESIQKYSESNNSGVIYIKIYILM